MVANLTPEQPQSRRRDAPPAQGSLATPAPAQPPAPVAPAVPRVNADDGGMRMALQILGELTTRAKLGSFVGQSFGGNRELYTACGYPTSITYAEYFGRYQRQDLAHRVVHAYPDATWRTPPQVYETEDETETAFEKAWKALLEAYPPFWGVLKRADLMAQIGRYSVVLIGLDGKAQDLAQPAGPAKSLLFLQPYDEEHAKINSWNQIITDKNYGSPEYYNLTATLDENDLPSLRVHFSRVLHIAENTLGSEWYGAPRMESIWNRLQDIETICGGSAEMFWETGFPGLQAIADPDAEITTQSKKDLEDQMQDYVHKLRRILRLKGIEMKSIPSGTADPTNHTLNCIKLISAGTGIPMRILLGTEEAQLAGRQDKESWSARVAERRELYGTNVIIRPLIERLVERGILPKPEQVLVEWPALESVSEQEQANIAKTKTDSMAAYVGGSVDALVPPHQYLTLVLKYSEEEAAAIEEAAQELKDEEQAQADEAAAQAAEEAAKNPPPAEPAANPNPFEKKQPSPANPAAAQPKEGDQNEAE